MYLILFYYILLIYIFIYLDGKMYIRYKGEKKYFALDEYEALELVKEIIEFMRFVEWKKEHIF